MLDGCFITFMEHESHYISRALPTCAVDDPADHIIPTLDKQLVDLLNIPSNSFGHVPIQHRLVDDAELSENVLCSQCQRRSVAALSFVACPTVDSAVVVWPRGLEYRPRVAKLERLLRHRSDQSSTNNVDREEDNLKTLHLALKSLFMFLF